MPNFLKNLLPVERIKPGAILTGLVVDISPEVIVVSAGLKSEAIIPTSQFRNEQGDIEVAIGDEVEVALDAVEDGSGETSCRASGPSVRRTWEQLEDAFENGKVVTGIINGRVKGGFTVDIDFVRAFLPGSLVDMRPVRDPSYLEGKDLEFKVIKLDQKRNNVVVSRRAVVEEEYSAERETLLSSLQEGATSRASSRTSPTTVLSWTSAASTVCCTSPTWRGSACKHPSEVVNVGDEIDVKILRFDREKNRVSLWHQAAGRGSVGEHRAALSAEHALCSARSPTLPTTAASLKSRTASKAWCTCPRWTGPTRTSIPPRSCRLAMKSRSWCSTSTKSAAASRWD